MTRSVVCIQVNLSYVGLPDSTTCKEPNNGCGEDAMFDVLPSYKPPVVQIDNSLLISAEGSSADVL